MLLFALRMAATEHTCFRSEEACLVRGLLALFLLFFLCFSFVFSLFFFCFSSVIPFLLYPDDETHFLLQPWTLILPSGEATGSDWLLTLRGGIVGSGLLAILDADSAP